MANSIEEAIQEAIAEMESKNWVIVATEDTTISEDKPGNFLRKRLDVFHESGNGCTYSGKEFYINKATFVWYWHYGGAGSPALTAIKEFINSKLDVLKAQMGADWIEIVSINENTRSAIIEVLVPTTGKNCIRYLIKAYKEGANADYKIIEKHTVV